MGPCRYTNSMPPWRTTKLVNRMIFDDVLSALEAGRSPVVTERKDHLQTISERLVKFAKNVIVLKEE
jgi:hypothetical protein